MLDMMYLLILLICKVQSDLQYIKEDLSAVERHRMELYQARERCSVKLKMLSGDPLRIRSRASSRQMDRNIPGLVSNSYNIRGGITCMNSQYKKNEGKAQVNIPRTQSKEVAPSEPTSQHLSQSGLAVMRKKRVHAQVSVEVCLTSFYLGKNFTSCECNTWICLEKLNYQKF